MSEYDVAPSDPPDGRLWRRFMQLYAGLVTFAVGEALVIRAGLGLTPWDVLHQGLVQRPGLCIGTWSVIVGALVLVLWLPLRERPGVGTVSNVLVIGAVLDQMLKVDVTTSTSPASMGAIARSGRTPGPRAP